MYATHTHALGKVSMCTQGMYICTNLQYSLFQRRSWIDVPSTHGSDSFTYLYSFMYIRITSTNQQSLIKVSRFLPWAEQFSLSGLHFPFSYLHCPPKSAEFLTRVLGFLHMARWSWRALEDSNSYGQVYICLQDGHFEPGRESTYQTSQSFFLHTIPLT